MGLQCLLSLAFGLAGCFEARHDPHDRAPTDASVPGASAFAELLAEARTQASEGGPVTCPPDPSPLSTLTFTVRTVAIGGRYSPRNVGAIWVQHAGGKWVATLERWGLRRAKWLEAFNEASGGNVADAITGATLAGHEVHEVTWDLSGPDGCEVEGGAYTLWMELADRSGTGVTWSVAFDKGAQPLRFSPDDQENFRDMVLALE